MESTGKSGKSYAVVLESVQMPIEIDRLPMKGRFSRLKGVAVGLALAAGEGVGEAGRGFVGGLETVRVGTGSSAVSCAAGEVPPAAIWVGTPPGGRTHPIDSRTIIEYYLDT
jgi:hypothetical protein